MYSMKFFLSASFSSQTDTTGKVKAAYRKDIEALIQSLEEYGHEIFCALKSENWKMAVGDPVAVLHSDLDEIDNCEIYVAILSDHVSAGVQFETGYAVARKKRIIMASPAGQTLGWTNNALTGFENVSNVNFEFYDELANQIQHLVSR